MNQKNKNLGNDGCLGPISPLGLLLSLSVFVFGGGPLGAALLFLGLPVSLVLLAPLVAVALFWWIVSRQDRPE